MVTPHDEIEVRLEQERPLTAQVYEHLARVLDARSSDHPLTAGELRDWAKYLREEK